MSEEQIVSIIIDDDVFIRDLLRDKLEQHVPDVELAGTALSGKEGIQLIQKTQPDLVFLDVEMTDMTGFEMLSQLEAIDFQVIFITSYSHYAVKAIRFNALDYLLKPIDLGELRKSIERYRERMKSNPSASRIKRALRNMHTPRKEEMELTLQLQEGTLYLPIKDIIRIEGERNYSYIHLANKEKKLISKTISDFEDLLDDKGFFRSHKSHLINLSFLNAHNRLEVTLLDDTSIPIARRRLKDFITLMGKK